MSISSKGTSVAAVRRQNSIGRKISSPKLIKKKSFSSSTESPKDEVLSQSLTGRNYQDSPQSGYGSYPEVSASDFIQQCILNLPKELGTPVERCPLPEGSEDFRRVMQELHSQEVQNAAGSGSEGLGSTYSAPKGSPSSLKTHNAQPDLNGPRLSENSNELRKSSHTKLIRASSLTGPSDSPRPSRRHGGQWSHTNLPRQSSFKASEEKHVEQKRPFKQEDIFSFSSDSEDERSEKTSVSGRHKSVSRQSSQRSSKSHVQEPTPVVFG